jgi:microsomal dipeptidase-like Zn-dependent dipeptidase
VGVTALILATVSDFAVLRPGLSRFGRDVVAESNRLGVVIDCAHASYAANWG